jgi:hypothetical protein
MLLPVQTAVKRHRYAEKIEEEVMVLLDKLAAAGAASVPPAE